mgnify:CR=1 FL=1|jgi:triosephosphate isomerase (TIM)
MKYIVGNWKMNLGIRESVALARGILRSLRGNEKTPEVVLCPSFPALSEVRKVLTRSRVRLGGQNCGIEKSGAFTGDVSISMLEDVACKFVIIGHSERRHVLGETDEMVSKKLKLAMESGMTPILCVGEPKDVREAGDAISYIQSQLKSALDGMSTPRKKRLLVAYEPVWAIGSGKPADVGDIIEMHQIIRGYVEQNSRLQEKDISVLYGGSVKSDNAYQYLREGEIDGLLVGGASLKLAQFSGILAAGIEVIQAQD